MGYVYKVCHPIGRQLLAPPLRLINPQWTEKVNGIATFEAQVALPSDPLARAQLRSALEPDESALYAIADNDTIPFAGVIVDAPWNPHDQLISIKAAGWRSWPYAWFLPPELDLSGDILYSWTNVDQLQIAREILGYAIAGGSADGRPPITIGTETSGKTRDLTVKGLDFKYAGELMDTMARRSGGFEWDLRGYIANDGLPAVRLALGYPELGSFQNGYILRNTPKGANFSVNGDIPRSTTARRTRVWTTGANSTDTLPFAVDSDPNIGPFVLASERVTSYSTVLERETLASHARAERIFLNEKTNVLNVTVQSTVIDPSSYSVGDRFRLKYEDGWYELDLPAVRVISRTIRPNVDAGVADLELDLSDNVMPDVDEGVSAP